MKKYRESVIPKPAMLCVYRITTMYINSICFKKRAEEILLCTCKFNVTVTLQIHSVNYNVHFQILQGIRWDCFQTSIVCAYEKVMFLPNALVALQCLFKKFFRTAPVEAFTSIFDYLFNKA